MPVTRSEAPQSLHLPRLAQATPGEWVRLPGGHVQIVALAGTLTGPAVTGWLICLGGEVIVDLPLNNFVRLRSGEGHRVRTDEAWTAFGTREGSVLLLTPDAG
ncbi:hypothetical protein [Deinococcus aerophilus]|uniref:Uncharacterized protein n=1 Tax=Deinococcus aerophilus TaxID=522488 RepID=A0ABQ2GUM8_9DEIO|nr:hypothetical protein [Deinococcus aerophilus]GGM14094.1 hypothetical protein GCM10010841_23390 [Deinococcus aerophilus]